MGDNKNLDAVTAPFKEKKAKGLERWENLKKFIAELKPEDKDKLPPIPEEPDPTWMDTVESFRDTYSQSQEGPREGNPDNNSPGANVTTGRGRSPWASTEDDGSSNGETVTPGAAIQVKSPWAKEEQETDESWNDVRERYSWATLPADKWHTNDKTALTRNLKNSGLISSEYPLDSELMGALDEWAKQNGFDSFNSRDAKRKMAQQLGESNR